MDASESQLTLQILESRIRTILPEDDQDSYDEVQPVSMGSAGLKYSPDGSVAWDEIWGSFCDLAMAGGPPHKGKLLEPGSREEIERQPGRYREVVDEICRGVNMVTGLSAQPATTPGWVRVACESDGMAGWLVRAIVMENVSVRMGGSWIELPAGPAYRLDKEIKNVITVIAKTCHYFADHMWPDQQRDIAELFVKMEAEAPLVQPAAAGVDIDAAHRRTVCDRIAAAILQTTGLQRADLRYEGWLGLKCPTVRAAIWMMRSLVVCNVLARREEDILFVAVNPVGDPEGQVVAQAVSRVYRFATARGVL